MIVHMQVRHASGILGRITGADDDDAAGDPEALVNFADDERQISDFLRSKLVEVEDMAFRRE